MSNRRCDKAGICSLICVVDGLFCSFGSDAKALARECVGNNTDVNFGALSPDNEITRAVNVATMLQN